MTTTLQEALLKAGLVSKEKLKKVEAEQRRPQGRRGSVPPARSKGFIEGKHAHHLRNQCEHCERFSPDVEYYEHRNQSLSEKWLCVKCADQYNIEDRYRQTMQSQNTKSGLFRREYGATKVFK